MVSLDDVVYFVWVWIIRGLLWTGATLTVLCSVDRVIATATAWSYWLQISTGGKRPEDSWAKTDLSALSISQWPRVAVQIPLFNDMAVARQVIQHCCALDWPKDLLVVQVLDDSTSKVTSMVVDDAVRACQRRGVEVVVRRRENRSGYKAGALKQGMGYPEMADVQFIAVFDSDFAPKPDFLRQTVPYLIANEQVGFVQSRWTFRNGNETVMTQAQDISLTWHHLCENYALSATRSFFHFNGTAGLIAFTHPLPHVNGLDCGNVLDMEDLGGGSFQQTPWGDVDESGEGVWRKKTIDDAGGWLARTTVEDADLSLRAYFIGYQPLYLADVTVRNELPADVGAYRRQQHRWSCGSVVLSKLMWPNIWQSESLTVGKKIYMALIHLGLRKVPAPMTLLFYYVVFPIAVLTGLDNVWFPGWALLIVMVTAVLSVICTVTASGWRGVLLLIPWVFFDNCVALVRVIAVITGLVGAKRSNEWKVTKKLGGAAQAQTKNSSPGSEASNPAPASPTAERSEASNCISPTAAPSIPDPQQAPDSPNTLVSDKSVESSESGVEMLPAPPLMVALSLEEQTTPEQHTKAAGTSAPSPRSSMELRQRKTSLDASFPPAAQSPTRLEPQAVQHPVDSNRVKVYPVEVVFATYLILMAFTLFVVVFDDSPFLSIGVGVACLLQGSTMMAFGLRLVDTASMCGSSIMCCAPNASPLTPSIGEP